MVMYFSGTGNSRFVAEKLAEQVKDECLDLFEKLRSHDYGELHSERPVVLVCPTYAWRMPLFLEAWLEKVALTGSTEIYFVLTCGADIGNAPASLKKLCHSRGWTYQGCGVVIMPSNYIAMFPDVKEEEAVEVIRAALPSIEQLAKAVASGAPFTELPISLTDRLISGAVCSAFYAFLVKDKQFAATDACIGCGKCERECVFGNIQLINGKPVWHGNCTHCMACIDGCPKDAIEYGRSTRGKVRYKFPSKEKWQ